MDSPLSTFVFLYIVMLLALLPLTIHSKQQELHHSSSPPPWRPPPPSPNRPPSPRSSSTAPPGHRWRSGMRPHSPNRSKTKRSSRHIKRRAPPLPPPARKLNNGKKLGLVFAGVAAILQIFVVTYLIINKRQLMKAHDRY